MNRSRVKLSEIDPEETKEAVIKSEFTTNLFSERKEECQRFSEVWQWDKWKLCSKFLVLRLPYILTEKN